VEVADYLHVLTTLSFRECPLSATRRTNSLYIPVLTHKHRTSYIWVSEKDLF